MADDVQVKETAETPADVKPAVAVRSTKPRRQVPRGNVYVHASYNNTMITITDPKGDTLAWSTAGSCGFKGPRKSTPYAASIVVREALKKLEGVGFREANVFISGVGSGRESAVRALNANGILVIGIKDVTPIPHNGCRPPKPRRI
ncbi:30S ribosomal protein S11 [Candidatus Uhrbacteria bacterium]|nr:30S ribosomal protein S11 [Candidatus Uhrbacteria bacterium]